MSKKNKVNSTYNQPQATPKVETNYYDIVSLLFIASLFVIDFLPLFKSIEILGPQYIYLSILNVIIGLYIFNNPSLISENLIAFCKKSLVLKLYFAFIGLCGISVFFATNTSLGIVNFSRLIVILFTLLNLIVLFYNRLHLIYQITFIVSVSLFFQSFGELYDFIKTYNAKSAIDALNDLKGNTGSINILASSVSIKIPFVLIGILHFEKWKKWFLIFVFILAVCIIFLTGSRATYLSLFSEIIIFTFVYFNFFKINRKSILTVSYIVIIGLFGFFISNQVFKKTSGNSRFESTSSRIKQIANLEDRSVNLRFIYWENATKIIKNNPLIGVGVGNWKTESIPYENEVFNDRFISNNTHNDFLEVMTETGILNGLIFVLLFLVIGFINIKRIIKSRDTKLDIIALVSLLCLISYCIDSIFNFPLYRPTMQLGFCLFFVLTLINTSQIEESKSTDFGKKYAVLLFVISVVTAFVSFKIFKAYQLENSIRSNFVTKNFNLKVGEIVSELPKYPNVFTSGEPFATYAGKYFIQEKNYVQAIKYLNIGHKINPNLGRTEYYKATIARETNQLDSAYVYSKKALEIRPRVKDYYVQAVNDAIAIKDSLKILEIHKMYTKYNNAPEIWINTSSALSITKYSTKKLIEFIDEGLKNNPESTILLERKALFESNSKKTSSNDYTQKAIAFFKQKNYTKALEELQKALKVDPSNPKVIKNIAICKSMIK